MLCFRLLTTPIDRGYIKLVSALCSYSERLRQLKLQMLCFYLAFRHLPSHYFVRQKMSSGCLCLCARRLNLKCSCFDCLDRCSCSHPQTIRKLILVAHCRFVPASMATRSTMPTVATAQRLPSFQQHKCVIDSLLHPLIATNFIEEEKAKEDEISNNVDRHLQYSSTSPAIFSAHFSVRTSPASGTVPHGASLRSPVTSLARPA